MATMDPAIRNPVLNCLSAGFGVGDGCFGNNWGGEAAVRGG
jgi:hypothetical protein